MLERHFTFCFSVCLHFDFADEDGKRKVLAKRFLSSLHPAMMRRNRNSGSFNARPARLREDKCKHAFRLHFQKRAQKRLYAFSLTRRLVRESILMFTSKPTIKLIQTKSSQTIKPIKAPMEP
jgi:hypothetical protein